MSKKQLVIMSGAALLAMGFVGCTKDAAYDQLTEENGIDLTITVAGNGLTVPVGSIDTIWLTEIMDPNKTEILKIDETTNTFYLDESGSLETSQFEVQAINLSLNPKLAERDFALDVKKDWGPLWTIIDAQNTSTSLASFVGEETVIASRDKMELGAIDSTNINFRFENNDVDPMIVEVTKIGMESPVEIKINLGISNLPAVNETYSLKIKDIKLYLPSFVTVLDEDMNVMTRDSEGTISIKDAEATKAVGSTSLTWNMPKIYIKDFDFSADPLKNVNGTILREDSIRFEGNIEILNLKITGADLVVLNKKEGEEHKTVSVAKRIHFKPEVSISNININRAEGIFRPDIKDLTTETDLKMDDKLDFITYENTVIDVKKMLFGIDLSTNTSIAGSAELKLSNNNSKTLSVKDVKIATHDNDPIHLEFTNDVEDRANNKYKIDGFSTFLSPIPEHISVGVGLEVNSINLGKPINVNGRYNLYVPLEFNSIASIYEEVIEDIFDSDITDKIPSIESATLRLVVESALGIDTELSVSARGADKKENPSLINCQNTGTLKAGSVAKPTTSEIEIAISVADMAAVKDLIVKIDAKGNDVKFSPDQYLLIKKIDLTIKNQTINLNDK